MAVLHPATAFRRSLSVRIFALKPPFRDCPARAQRPFVAAHPNHPVQRVKPERPLTRRRMLSLCPDTL
jgi:hypothetical protein